MYKLVTPYASSFGKPNVVINHFPDTESYVLIPKVDTLKGKNVMINHTLYPDPGKRIFELLLLLSKVKEQTNDIELFVPYLPYARQDRENKKGEAVSADVLCELLKSFKIKKLVTYDCHFLPGPGTFKRSGLEIENRSAGKDLFNYAKKYFGKNKFLIISPDEGASYFTENAQGHKGHALKKMRKDARATGLKTEIEADVHKIEGDVDVKGKNICILDDIIATGGTIVKAVEHLKSRGAAKIIVGATHGVFAREGISKKILDSGCSKIFISNSILKDGLEKSIAIVDLA